MCALTVTTSFLVFHSIAIQIAHLAYAANKPASVLIHPGDVLTALCKHLCVRHGFSNVFQLGCDGSGHPYPPQSGSMLCK